MYLVFIFIGLLGIFYAIYVISSLSDFQKKGIEVNGTILSYDSDYEGYRTPIIEFTTLNGIEIENKPKYYSSSDLGKVIKLDKNINSTITILYDPKFPERFIIKDEVTFSHIGIIFLTILSLVSLAIGIFKFIYM